MKARGPALPNEIDAANSLHQKSIDGLIQVPPLPPPSKLAAYISALAGGRREALRSMMSQTCLMLSRTNQQCPWKDFFPLESRLSLLKTKFTLLRMSEEPIPMG